MKNKNKIIIGIVSLLIIGATFFAGSKIFPEETRPEEENFQFDGALLKTIMKEKNTLKENVSLENKNSSNNFELEIKGVKGIAELKKQKVEINEGESQKIQVKINVTGVPSGIYVGSLQAKNEKARNLLPMIIEIRTKDPEYGININADKEDKQTKINKSISPEIEIVNMEGEKVKEANITHALVSLDGKKEYSKNEKRNLKPEKRIEKIIEITEEYQKGKHVFTTKINHKNETSTASYLLEIGKRDERNGLGNVLGIAAIILIILVATIVIINISREKVKSEKERPKNFSALEKKSENLK